MLERDFLFKVDSCKLSIELEKCVILNSELEDYFSEFRVNESTAEIKKIKEKKRIPYQISYPDGTSVKIWIAPQSYYFEMDKRHGSKEYIILLVNSKHIQQRYFDGITTDTFKYLYEYMMSLNVFKCSYKSFQSARYSDVDICFDFKCNSKEFAILKKNILRSVLEPLHFHQVNKEDNSGIWAPTMKEPRKQATPAKPFIKFYSKDIEFKYNSKTFADTYFKPEDYKDLVRFECNIKDQQHKKKLGINKIPTFWKFLNSDLRTFAIQIFGEYFKKINLMQVRTELKPMDKVLLDLINMSIGYGASPVKILNVFKRYDVNAKARQRLMIKYQELYLSGEMKKEKLQANEKSKNVFSILGQKVDFDDDGGGGKNIGI